MFRTVIGASVAAAALGKINWTPGNIEEIKAARRLALNLATSTTNYTDPGCIVGGFDSDHPSKIYIGGPCSELTVTLNAEGDVTDANPKAGFHWVEMESVHMEIVGKNETDEAAPFKPNSDDQFVVAEEKATHAEVAMASTFHLDVEGMKHAGLFASTTSYLSKGSFKFSKNAFCIAEDKTEGKSQCGARLEQCAVPCCASPPCACTSCPIDADGVSVVPGQYKYSIMAAAYNEDGKVGGAAFVPGAAGNGWAKIVDQHGEGSPKALAGNMDWFQTIDFTNMHADTLTVMAPDGSSTKYADMGTCNLKTGAGCDANVYGVKAVEVESNGGFTGAYVFPTTSNVGTWNLDTATMQGTTAVEATRVVQIHCIKPDAASMVALGMAETAESANGKKAVILRYRFDITGITATGKASGKFMNYDPTIAQKGSAAHTAAMASSGNGGAAGATGGAATGGATAGGAGNTTNATTGAAAASAATGGSDSATAASGAMQSAMPAAAAGFALMAASILV